MNQEELQAHVAEATAEAEVTGIAVGVYHEGTEHYAFHGVTSVENPLPVDASTLFVIGSTAKTYTATAIMRLVERGDVRLDERVRAYVPELRLADESVAEAVTVLQLLNHTGGWDGDLEIDTGEGDDALAAYVARLVDVRQVGPLGGAPSYNNAAFSVAGRVIENVTATTFERAIQELVLDPLRLEETFQSPLDVMTRRFAVGHVQGSEGAARVVRPWHLPRGKAPAGSRLAATAADHVAWARFHLGDGRAADGTRVLEAETLARMQQPTAGSDQGEQYGIAWMLRTVDGLKLVEHGGDSAGQHSAFSMAPEHDFAITILTNCGPNGQQLREELVRWGLEAYLGVTVRDPEPADLSLEQLAEYTGTFDVGGMLLHATAAEPRLRFETEAPPEALEQAGSDGDDASAAMPPPFLAGVLPGAGDRFVIIDGPYKGMRGYFVRDEDGRVSAVNVGRLGPRVA